MEQRLTIVGLGVANIVTATQFYETAFGWKKTEASNDNISFFKLNGILLSLYNTEKLAEDATVPSNGSGFRGFSLAHNLRSKKEVDELISQLRNKGVTIVKEPQEVFWGGYSSYVSDPDGNLWEIAYNPYLKLDDFGDVG